MELIPGYSEVPWQLATTSKTNTLDYWLNWRFFICAIWVLLPLIAASILIRNYEGSGATKHENGEILQEAAGTLYEDEAWRPCLKEIHPAWLLAFRILVFFMLLMLLIIYVIIHRGVIGIFFFYTHVGSPKVNSNTWLYNGRASPSQMHAYVLSWIFYLLFVDLSLPGALKFVIFQKNGWTFLLVTIYFGLGSLLSIYGCYQFLNSNGDKINVTLDTEGGTCVPLLEENADFHGTVKRSVHQEENDVRRVAGIWSYSFQIIYQTCAGAAMLTDVVFWLIIFPFLTYTDYKLNFLIIGMHSVNFVVLLGDTALNCLRFPWFRISYFVYWTSMFVIFQWIVHACFSLRWPYPFLSLASPYAPVWYFLVALLHIPCYAIFALVVKMKHYVLSRWFPQSYHCLK